MSTPRRCFIFHDGALGDLLLSLPAIAAIRRDHDFVHLAGSPVPSGLLRQCGLVDETSPASGSRYLSLFSSTHDRQLDDFLSGFEEAVVFFENGNAHIAGNIGRTVHRVVPVLKTPPAGSRVHVTAFRSGQLPVPEQDSTGEPLLAAPDSAGRRAEAILESRGLVRDNNPLIGIHPGSGGKSKCWPMDRYSTLTEMLRNEIQPALLFFSGPAEGDDGNRAADRLAAVGGDKSLHICNAPLEDVAGFLSHCDLYAGNDSGITHLAASLGLPVVALFGPTDPLLWSPRSRNAEIIRPDIECAPCERNRHFCSQQVCLENISAKAVFRHILRKLEARPGSPPESGGSSPGIFPVLR